MYCQDFCSGLLTVMAVYVGINWALPPLPCLRWLKFGTRHDAGEARVATGRQFRIAHTLAAARGCRTGGVAGAEPPHKGGRLRPTAQRRGESEEERGERNTLSRAES